MGGQMVQIPIVLDYTIARNFPLRMGTPNSCESLPLCSSISSLPEPEASLTLLSTGMLVLELGLLEVVELELDDEEDKDRRLAEDLARVSLPSP